MANIKELVRSKQTNKENLIKSIAKKKSREKEGKKSEYNFVLIKGSF